MVKDANEVFYIVRISFIMKEKKKSWTIDKEE